MKQTIPLFILISCLFCSCGPAQDKFEKIVEDGVEVVLNHIEPYQLKGESSTFSLKEEFRIDTEMDKIAKIGLTDLRSFDVDSQGNIYFLKMGRGKGNNIFKFDKTGRFISSFGMTGQGPGEFQSPTYIGIDNRGDVIITDRRKRKLIVFDNKGSYKKEIPFKKNVGFVHPLENGNYLTFYQVFYLPDSDYFSQSPLSLWSSEFEELKELDRFKVPNYLKYKKRKGTVPIFCWGISKKHIYIGNEDRGYEIWIYDLDGNLLRKIRKDYKKVPIPDEYKKERMKNLVPEEKNITYFPAAFPPYRYFFTDHLGRLFVMTYEKGENLNEYMYDIFNNGGIFIGRKSLKSFFTMGRACVKVRQNFLYGIEEKDSGYKELVVYKMTWE